MLTNSSSFYPQDKRDGKEWFGLEQNIFSSANDRDFVDTLNEFLDA